MKVKYGISSSNLSYALACVLVSLLVGGLSCVTLIKFGAVHRSVLRSRLTNLTSDDDVACCGIPYEELHCSVLQSTDDEDCLSDNELLWSRILLPVVMAMDVHVLQLPFKIRGKYSRFVVCALWIIFAFALIIIPYNAYFDSCFRHYSSIVVSYVGILFGGAVWFCVLKRIDRIRGDSLSFDNENSFHYELIEFDDFSTENMDDSSTEDMDDWSTEKIDDKLIL